DNPELAYFPQWLDEGHAGEMHYLAAKNEAGELKRASLRTAAPWARSIVVCALNYNTAAPRSVDCKDKSRGWISRYAWSQADYHDVILSRLRMLESDIKKITGHPELRTWCYVDTGPIVERVAAKYAGIGWIAKNTCIINEKIGSWLFLGVV